MSNLANEPVAPDTFLYRRVHPVHYKSLPDGTCRLRETAFKNPKDSNDMSVQLGDTLECLEIRPECILDGYDESWGLAEFRAQVAIEQEQDVERSPKQNDEAHGDVVGAKPTGRRRVFAEAARWTVVPRAQEP
jgi:hypothetical protein